MATGPPFIIPAPGLTQPPTGLLRAATIIEHPDLYFGAALEWAPESCSNATVIDPCVGGPFSAFQDGVENSTTTFTSATAAFTGADVGRPINGAGIPSGTVIASVTNATTVILSQAATATATGVHFAITGRTVANNHPATIRYDAFEVEARDTCSAFGFETVEYEARARRLLAARESKAVEAEWWVGAMFPANPHLAKASSTNGPATTSILAGAAQSLRTGLSLLTQYLADNNGGIGMIHARPFLVSQWYGLDLIYRDGGGKLWTGTGNAVVAGTGYPGTGPAGEARTASSEWAFVTDDVYVHRGEVFVPTPGISQENVDRYNNQITVRAMRPYALAFNGCVLGAVNIDPTKELVTS